MPVLVNVNKWAGFTVFLMLNIHTMQAATRSKVEFMVCTEFQMDAGEERRKARLTCCLTFLREGCCSPDKVTGIV